MSRAVEVAARSLGIRYNWPGAHSWLARLLATFENYTGAILSWCPWNSLFHNYRLWWACSITLRVLYNWLYLCLIIWLLLFLFISFSACLGCRSFLGWRFRLFIRRLKVRDGVHHVVEFMLKIKFFVTQIQLLFEIFDMRLRVILRQLIHLV